MKNLKSILNSLVSALFLVFATASHVFANNGPGPLAIVSMFSLVILLVALTFAGGGYQVMKLIDDAKYPSKAKRTIYNVLTFIAGVVLFFAGVMASIIGVVVLSLFTIGRGVKMLQWARDAAKEGTRPAHLDGANPKKLKVAGIMLIVLTVLVFGYSIINIEDVIGIDTSYRARGYAAMLNAEAKNAKTYAEICLLDNPKAKVVTCEDLVKAGYTPSPKVTCFSDLTATSGSIRITGQASWKLKNPTAAISHAGELTPAER